MTTRRIQIAACTALLVLPDPAPADAYCLWPQNWQGYTAIPVYHTSDLAASLWHYDGSQWAENEVHHELRWILASINSYSDAQLPLLYDAGVSAPCTTNCQIPEAINIAPVAACSPPAYANGTAAAGFEIRIGSSPVCGNLYDHFGPTSAWGRWVLRGSLMHEMGHAMGLGHPYGGCDNLTCATVPCAAMQVGGGTLQEGQNYYTDDVLGLRAIYGAPYYPQREHWESADGISWYPLVSSTPPTDLQPLFAASSSTGSRMFVTYRYPLNRRPRAWHWNSSPPLTWTDWGDSTSSTTLGHTGSAWDPATFYGYSSWLFGETQTNVVKYFGLTRHTSSSSKTEYTWGGASTRRHGVSLTHDPKTNARVQVWRANMGEIKIQVIDGTTFIAPWTLTNASGPVQAYDTPTVTCGDASISFNCIVAWASPALAGEAGSAAHYHFLRWRHFSLTNAGGGSWSISYGPIMSQSWIMHGSPFVSYRGPATASRPYTVMWVSEYATDRNFRVYTALKSTASGATWDNVVAHPLYNWRPAAALGSVSSYAEIVHARR